MKVMFNSNRLLREHKLIVLLYFAFVFAKVNCKGMFLFDDIASSELGLSDAQEQKRHDHTYFHSERKAKPQSSMSSETNLQSPISHILTSNAKSNQPILSQMQKLDFLSHFGHLLKKINSEKRSSSLSSSFFFNDFCRNPQQDFLEDLLSKYQVLYMKYEESILKTKIQDSIALFESKLDQERADSSQCDIFDRNSSSVNQQSLCPWKYVITRRNDRFPTYRTQVQCTCERCTAYGKNEFLPKQNFGCKPVSKPMPVLVQDECDKETGYYNWKPSTEQVSVACVCAHLNTMIPHI
jgi:hypothetical protein